MKVTLAELSETKKKVNVEVPKEKVNEEINATYKELKKTAHVKGFRPGKAPRSVLEAYYHEQVSKDVSSKLVEEISKKAFEENKLEPLSISDTIKGELMADKDFTYSFEIEVKPVFDVNYDNLTYEEKEVKVTEDELNKVIEAQQDRFSILKEVTDRKEVRVGDFVDIEIKSDGVSKKKDTIEVGKGYFFKEFEDKLVNLLVGSEEEISVKFPEDYNVEELKNKEKIYSAKILAIKQKELPAIDDELAKSCGDYENLVEFRKDIEERLKIEKENANLLDVKNQIANQLIEKNPIKIPESLIYNHKVIIISNQYNQFEKIGYAPSADFVKDSLASEEITEKATRNAKISLIFDAIAVRNNITVSDEEVNEKVMKIAESHKVSYNDLLKKYREDRTYIYIRDSILEDRIVNFLKSNIRK